MTNQKQIKKIKQKIVVLINIVSTYTRKTNKI